MQKVEGKKIDRILDANLNRAKEGLRVCEDVCRFIFDDPRDTRRYKHLRHQLTEAVMAVGLTSLVAARDSVQMGKKTSKKESRRTEVKEIFYANAQRVKESVRVLEEFAKLKDVRVAEKLKKLRYEIYGLEKDVIERFCQ